MPLVLVPEALHQELARAATDDPTIVLAPYSEQPDAPVDGVADAEGLLRWVAGKRFSALAADAPRLRWLHTASAGVDHVLTPAVRERAAAGMVVTDSGPAFATAIGEFVLARMLEAARALPVLAERQAATAWGRPEGAPRPVELAGKTVGVIGLGPIGLEVARLSAAFRMRVLGLRRAAAPAKHVDETLTGAGGLERLLAESDFVVLAAALTGETRHLIGAAQLARMKPAAWLVNIARGDMIDEPALVRALESGGIAGAALDVFAQEPLPASSPLWRLSSARVSPHDSGFTDGLRARQTAIFLDNLRRFAAGEPLANAVDIARGY